jgi:hypothetical protein
MAFGVWLPYSPMASALGFTHLPAPLIFTAAPADSGAATQYVSERSNPDSSVSVSAIT